MINIRLVKARLLNEFAHGCIFCQDEAVAFRRRGELDLKRSRKRERERNRGASLFPSISPTHTHMCTCTQSHACTHASTQPLSLLSSDVNPSILFKEFELIKLKAFRRMEEKLITKKSSFLWKMFFEYVRCQVEQSQVVAANSWQHHSALKSSGR